MPVNYDQGQPPDTNQLIGAIREVCPDFTEAFDTGMVRNIFADGDVVSPGTLLQVAVDYLIADLEKLGLELVGNTNELLTSNFGILLLAELRNRLDRENLISRLSAMSDDERVGFETFVLGDEGTMDPAAIEKFLAWMAGRMFGSDLIGAMRYWLTAERIAANEDFHDYIQWCVGHVESGVDVPDDETIDAVAEYMRAHGDMKERFRHALEHFRDEGHIDQDTVDHHLRNFEKSAAANVRGGNFNPPHEGAHRSAPYHQRALADRTRHTPVETTVVTAWLFSFTPAAKPAELIRGIDFGKEEEIAGELRNVMLTRAAVLGETTPPPPEPPGDQ